MSNPIGESREIMDELTRRAVADVVRVRMVLRRQPQTDLARQSGVSRSFVRAILHADKSVSLLLFLEISRGLGVDDPCELLREILDRRERMRAELDARTTQIG